VNYGASVIRRDRPRTAISSLRASCPSAGPIRAAVGKRPTFPTSCPPPASAASSRPCRCNALIRRVIFEIFAGPRRYHAARIVAVETGEAEPYPRRNRRHRCDRSIADREPREARYPRGDGGGTFHPADEGGRRGDGIAAALGLIAPALRPKIPPRGATVSAAVREFREPPLPRS
jgi:hypothetical protein